MMPLPTNKLARQISSIPTTHRASTLQAISQKAHMLSAQIVHVKANGMKLLAILDEPGDAGSALQRAQQFVNRMT